MTLTEALQLAMQLHQAGRLAEAETISRQILAVHPQQADALHLLGVIAAQAGRPEVAADLIRQAIAVLPMAAAFHSNLADVCRQSGRWEEAEAECRRALQLQPDFPEAHDNLGSVLLDQGRADDAIAAYRQAIFLRPGYARARQNLAGALQRAGQLEEAAAEYRRLIELQPNLPAAHNDLGNVLNQQGRIEDAAAAYRRALQLDPQLPEASNNLGTVLGRLGRFDEALAACQRAIQLRPQVAEMHHSLGVVLENMGNLDEAALAYRRAVELRPDCAGAHHHLGTVERKRFRLEEALACHRRALELEPGQAGFHNNLGNTLREQGRIDEALAAYRRALACDPRDARMHSNLLLTLHYRPDPGGEILREARHWAELHAQPLAKLIEPHGNERSPERRLRVGYVSADLRIHAVASFLEGLLAAHDPAQVEVFCYADVFLEDEVTHRLHAHAAHWRPIAGQPDDAVAALIRRDAIDLLVDLGGHTANHRLLVFARQPAPVQVAWLGYCGTTGLPAIGYRLTDPYADPPGLTESQSTERLVRLPDGAWCYRPPVDPPPVSRRDGPLTFGCFNARPKITPAILALWSRLLLAVPGARLCLKNACVGSPAGQEDILRSLESAGDRVDFLPWQNDAADHLAAYGGIDLALDTFPYHGTTTTCEALWMGVPVVTLAGATHASRVGVSLLTNAGLPEFIAHSPEEYVSIATRLADDRARLSELRATMRERLLASPLLDAPRLARHLEAAYREMWRRWCAQPSTSLRA